MLVDNSVTDLDDLDQLQGKLNDAREAKDFSKCQVLNEMQELKPHGNIYSQNYLNIRSYIMYIVCIVL